MNRVGIIQQLTAKQKAEGITRVWIPVERIIEMLEELKDPKKWKAGGTGGQDQYAGMPPAIRIVDHIIATLNQHQ